MPPSRQPSTRRPRSAVPRMLTARALVLFVVVTVSFVLLFPTVRGFLAERQHLAELRATAEAARQRTADLQAEIDRWQDEAYVVAQARERLAFVLPGETAYRVVDPEVVLQEAAADAAEDPAPGLPVPGAAPWYTQMWDSVVSAGVGGDAQDPAPEGGPDE